MKKIIFSIAVAIVLLYAHKTTAQPWSIGARGGLAIPNLSAGSGSEVNPLNKGYSSRVGAGFGVFVEVQTSKLFSLQAMVEYSQQGGQKNGFQAIPVPKQIAPLLGAQGPRYLYADLDSKAKLNYLMVPILAKFGWDLGAQKKWRIYAGAGPFAGLLLSAKQVTSGNSQVYFDEGKTKPVPANPTNPSAGILTLPFDNTQNIEDRIRSFNFGLSGNVGLTFKMKRNAIFIEGGANYGLINIQKGTANGKNKSGAATIMLGYAYSL
ncbi:porin family protein [Paenimyroides ceti]